MSKENYNAQTAQADSPSATDTTRAKFVDAFDVVKTVHAAKPNRPKRLLLILKNETGGKADPVAVGRHIDRVMAGFEPIHLSFTDGSKKDVNITDFGRIEPMFMGTTMIGSRLFVLQPSLVDETIIKAILTQLETKFHVVVQNKRR